MNNYEEMSLNEIKDILRKWRETNVRNSSDVMEMWFTVLQSNVEKLDNEKYVIIEQVLVAAMDCHCEEVIQVCFKLLANTFGKTCRVLKYDVANIERTLDYTAADELISNLKKYDETNPATRKQRIALVKSMKGIPSAIEELVEYLKKFMADAEAWQELCDLYLRLQEYTKAVFCAEELLLHQPHSHLHHQQVADIRYTMGGVENLEHAKAYYCHALKLNPQNTRALLGLYLATNSLLGHYKSGVTTKRKEVFKLNQWTLESVSKSFRDNDVTGPIAMEGDAMQLDALLNTLTIE